MPHMIIIAGPNGAGKTTAAPVLLKNTLHVDDFLNADVIAQGLCAFQPEKTAIQAGRIMLERIHILKQEKASFSFETTLASRSFSTWIPKLKKDGYFFHLIFLWLQNETLAISRVNERAKMGGHFVPEETVKRCYHVGLKNFFNLYEPLADLWQLYDNSNMNLDIIASKANHHKIIMNKNLWKTLMETYYENRT